MTTRRTAAAAALASLAAVAVVTGLGQASATAQATGAPDPGPRRRSPIHGHGYGHGHGLSQYGAEGAARAGAERGADRALLLPAHQGRHRRRARCACTSPPTPTTTPRSWRASGLKVRDLDNGSTVAVPTQGRPARRRAGGSRPAPAGRPRSSYLNSGWHLWRTLRGDARVPGRRPDEARRSRLGRDLPRHPAVAHAARHPGQAAGHGQPGPASTTTSAASSRARCRPCGTRRRSAPRRSRRAPTRAFEVADSTNPVYQLCDTTSCQVYGGMSAEFASTNEADDRDRRADPHLPAAPRRSRSSPRAAAAGPRTAASPTCPAQKDPYDGWSGNGVHTWSTTVGSGAIEKAWPTLGNLTGITVDSRDGHGQWNGRVVTMTLHGSKKDVEPQRRLVPARSRPALHVVQPRRGQAAQRRRARRGRGRPRGRGRLRRAGRLLQRRRRWCRACAPTRPAACGPRTTTPRSWPATSASRPTATSPAPARASATSPTGRTRSSRGPRSKPQVDALSKKTDLVTVGIGGNDFGLFGDLTSVCPGSWRSTSDGRAVPPALHRRPGRQHQVPRRPPDPGPRRGRAARGPPRRTSRARRGGGLPETAADQGHLCRGPVRDRRLRVRAPRRHPPQPVAAPGRDRPPRDLREHLRRLAGPRRVRRPPGVGQRPGEHREGCGVPPLREGGAGDGPARLPRADRRRRAAGRRRDAARRDRSSSTGPAAERFGTLDPST